ncbi:MAG: hypothetical protein AAF492_26095, partial [Verrucomicrobiota bacterium]
LRARIFLDRSVGDGSENNQVGVETAVQNLERLQRVTDTFQSDRLLHAGRAILARAYSKIGDIARAQVLISEEGTSSDTCTRAWEALFQIEALQGIDQARGEALRNKMPTILSKADPESARAISELRETYDQRADEADPAAFLARENRGRTYPRGPGTQEGLMYELSMRLEQHVREGNELSAIATMRSMMTIEDTSQYDDSIKLPQFVETLVAGIERFKWGERGASLTPLFEDFSQRAPKYLSTATAANPFYGSILRSNLALGLIVVENVEMASQQIKRAAKEVTLISNHLDIIDAAAALIRTIEQLPLTHRGKTLENLATLFKTKFDRPDSPYLVNERLFSVLPRMLDQMAEAGSSKDRLSLQQFRHYQLQDEFLILQRIQADQLCAPQACPPTNHHESGTSPGIGR